MIHRYRRRWLKKNTRPCPINCQSAIVVGKSRVIGCEGCGSHNIEQCTKVKAFVPVYTKEELYNQFRERIRNQEILLRDYRDIAALLWAVGGFDEEIDETVIVGLEKRTPDPNPSSGGTGSKPGPSLRCPETKPDDRQPKSDDPPAVPGQSRSHAVSSGNK